MTEEILKMPENIYVCRNSWEIIWDPKTAKNVESCSAYIKGKCDVDNKKCELIRYQKQKL